MEDQTKKSQLQSNRKKEHVYHFLNGDFDGNTMFRDIYLEHNALPEIKYDDITTKIDFLGKTINFPLMINAMTGGYDKAMEINGNLARLAVSFNIPMAVGSQSIALKDEEYAKSFRVVRETIKDGVVISNINGFASVEEVKRAVAMIEADGVQIHLNPAQEMCMPEGDRDFTGILNNIEKIVKEIEVPVIIKEVGFGLSRDVTKRLLDVGVSHIDIGGGGGTNFIKIEGARNEAFDYPELSDWGIPTALSLIENRQLNQDLKIICSGGMRQADEIVKALSIGANIIGISGPILRVLMEEGYEQAHQYIENIIYKSKVIMLLLGKRTVQDLRSVPYRIKGDLRDLLGDVPWK